MNRGLLPFYRHTATRDRSEIEKPAWVSPGGLLVNAGNHLRSHTLTRAVPSAQRGLTSVFGMGTGVTLAVWSPANRGVLLKLVPFSVCSQEP